MIRKSTYQKHISNETFSARIPSDLFNWFDHFLELNFNGDSRSERFRKFVYALKRGQEHPEAATRDILKSPSLSCAMQDIAFPNLDVKKMACQRCRDRTPDAYRRCQEKAI